MTNAQSKRWSNGGNTVKDSIHPKYETTTVTCSCGTTWETRSTRKNLRVDVCSACHPFYTGEQRIVDTAGQVERFMRRMGNRDAVRERTEQQTAAAQAARQTAAAPLPAKRTARPAAARPATPRPQAAAPSAVPTEQSEA